MTGMYLENSCNLMSNSVHVTYYGLTQQVLYDHDFEASLSSGCPIIDSSGFYGKYGFIRNSFFT